MNPRPAAAESGSREREVLALVAEGRSDDEIAHALFLSPLTVRAHIKRAKAKTEACDRARLVVFACQAGLVRPAR